MGECKNFMLFVKSHKLFEDTIVDHLLNLYKGKLISTVIVIGNNNLMNSIKT